MICRQSILAIALLFALPFAVRADEPSQLAEDLVGSWALAGTPDKPVDPPKKGGRLKFYTGKSWCITHHDPETGKVIFHHGGSYTIDGDKLTSTVEYANENTANRIGTSNNFKIKVESDTYTQIGLDNEFTELWKRVK